MGVQQAPAEVRAILGLRQLWIDVFAGTMVMTEGRYQHPRWGVLASVAAADKAAGIESRPQQKISFGQWGYVTFGIKDRDKVTVTQRMGGSSSRGRIISKVYKLKDWEEEVDARGTDG